MCLRENNHVTIQVDGTKYGLVKRSIYGLNIFARNGIRMPTADDPRIVFLRSLSDRHLSSAHVGAIALHDLVADPAEMFGPAEGAIPYFRTTIEYRDGFFDLSGWQYSPACFFPRITPRFWEASAADGSGDMEYVVRCAGLAVYVGASDLAIHEMTDALNAPFPGQAHWLPFVSGIYAMVLAVGHDGDYFDAYATNEQAFKLLEPSLVVAESNIASSEWFQDNAADLTWDEMSICLALDGSDSN